MPNIYINTDNSNVSAKIYKATRAGKSAEAVEKKMQAVIIAAVAKEAGFITEKSAAGKGYTIKLEITKVEKSGGDAIYTVHPEIVRYPPTAGKGGKGEEMVSTRVKDPTITATGERELLDGIEIATENVVKKSLPLMTIDMGNR